MEGGNKREIRIAPRRLDGQEEGTVGGTGSTVILQWMTMI